MSNRYFQFKQFTVWHDKCGMKVGTDGVLIGAWAKSAVPKRILDVGCGTGLISLMMAQRYPGARVTAIDIDDNAILQARENIGSSPFKDRIEVVQMDFSILNSELPNLGFRIPDFGFNLIVSNPPFFESTEQKPEGSRNIARHTDSLTFDALIKNSGKLLTDDGQFSVIIPYSSAQDFISTAAMNDLFLCQRCDVRNSETKPFKRSMLAFSRHISQTEITSLTLRTKENTYTDEYQALTNEFYL